MTSHPSLRRNLGRAHGFEALEVEGTLPEDLIGTLYRAGPGIYERFGARVEHAFEADGAITAARFDGNGGARGAAKIVESEGYREEQAAGRPLYGSTASWLQRLRNNFTQRSKNTGNTSTWVWQNRLFALMEGGRPTELDPETLDVLGERKLEVLGPTFSAHPHRVASLQTSFNFGVRFGRVSALDLYAMPDDGPVKRIGAVELPWATLVHDFVATEHHLVFVLCPAKLVLWKALLGVGGIGGLFDWVPARGCELIVVPLADPDNSLRIPCDPFWVWHFANGFARGTNEIVFDLCRYTDFSSLRAIDDGQPGAPPIYHRAVVDLSRERVRSEAIFEGAFEFPRVRADVQGREHRVVWMQHSPPRSDSGGESRECIARVEIESGDKRVWQPEASISVGEPVPVARPGCADEDEVWVLVLCHDEDRDRSFVGVLDGQDPEAGPVAKLWFDQTIPMSFHGSWVPASR